MTCRLIFVFLSIGLASMQAKAAVLLPPVVSPALPLAYNPLVEVLPPVLDVQARTALTCDRGPVSCGCGLDCRIPTSVSPVIAPACGYGLPTCASCGTPIPTAAYRAPVTVPVVNACGCGVSVPAALTTPLLPPLPPVLGCTKYLRQVCVQPPFL